MHEKRVNLINQVPVLSQDKMVINSSQSTPKPQQTRKNKRMKIALVVCPYEGEVRDRVTHKFYKPGKVKYMPLGLLSIAAHLKQHNIIIIDAPTLDLSVHQTLEEIDKFKPDILCLSVVTYKAWAMCEILKKSDVTKKAVGGPHATLYSQYIKDQGAHAVFIGPGEITFPAWIKAGCPEGIFHSQPIPLDTLPFPARELVQLDNYRLQNSHGLLFNAGNLRIPMYSSLGCPHRCRYCDIQQKHFDMKSPDKVLAEFQEILKLGATSIHILDDAFNINRERVKILTRKIIALEKNIDWSVRGRVEVDEDVIRSLSAAGCKRWHVGIEHLDDTILHYFRKSQQVKQIEKFCELCHKYQIELIAYFIMGAPTETDTYRKQLPKMIKNLGIRTPYFNVLTPLAGTDFYYDLLKNGVFKFDFWDEFAKNPVKDFIIPSHRNPDEEQDLSDLLTYYIDYFHTESLNERKLIELGAGLPR